MAYRKCSVLTHSKAREFVVSCQGKLMFVRRATEVSYALLLQSRHGMIVLI